MEGGKGAGEGTRGVETAEEEFVVREVGKKQGQLLKREQSRENQTGREQGRSRGSRKERSRERDNRR